MSIVIGNPNLLTKEQKIWFAERMTESHTGRVLIPGHLYEKFRKLTDSPHLSNGSIKSWLIDYVYNGI